jgi:hypothetical protein
MLLLLLLLLLTCSLSVIRDTISLCFKVLWTPSADNFFKVLSRGCVAALGFCRAIACSAVSLQRRLVYGQMNEPPGARTLMPLCVM